MSPEEKVQVINVIGQLSQLVGLTPAAPTAGATVKHGPGYVLSTRDHEGATGALFHSVDGTYITFFDPATHDGKPYEFLVGGRITAVQPGMHCVITTQGQPPYFDKFVGVEVV